MIKTVLAALAIAGLAGCATQGARAPGSPVEGVGSHSSFTSAARICRVEFSHHVVLGWTAADVADLRAYRYGGPVPHVPLRSAFSGMPTNTHGAWCLVLEGHRSAGLWGAVPGKHPQRAIIITGPGENRRVGEMHRPPQVP
jgi:hypothetical protein